MWQPIHFEVALGKLRLREDTPEYKDKFQVELKEKQYAPEEITVKTVDGYIVVEGKHEEKKDMNLKNGYVSRQFTRYCVLPKGFIPDPESLEFKLSSKGVLTVTAQRKKPVAVQGESSTPVTQTAPVRNEDEDQAESDK